MGSAATGHPRPGDHSADYLDPALPVAERVEAILALMTDEQKLRCFDGVPEITLADGRTLPAHDNRFAEVLHGSGHHADATLFPQAIGLGATWNTELLERIGEVVGHEMRARDPEVLAAFGPVADIRSNPLAGRYEEAISQLRMVLAGRRRRLGKGHLDTLAVHHRLGRSHTQAGRPDHAVEVLREAYRAALNSSGDPEVRRLTVRLRRDLAGAYNAAGRHRDANALL